MKFLLTTFVIFAAFCYVVAGPAKEKMHAIVEECKTEQSATDDDVAAFLKHEALTTTEGKCMRSCILKKSELATEDGKLNVETFTKLIELLSHGDEEKENLGKQILADCMAISLPDDECEAAEAYSECFRTKAAENQITSIEFE